MAVYTDDLVYSLIRYLQTASFTAKDPTGAAELATDLFTDLFPTFRPEVDGRTHFVPTELYDLESMAYPVLGITVASDPTPVEAFYGVGALYEYQGRFAGVILDADAEEAAEMDYDASCQLALRVKNALENHFRQNNGRNAVPWVRYTYNEDGDITTHGEFVVRDFRVTGIDGPRFTCSFVMEIMD